jgi:membrane-bound lytic murein transglycosylase A
MKHERLLLIGLPLMLFSLACVEKKKVYVAPAPPAIQLPQPHVPPAEPPAVPALAPIWTAANAMVRAGAAPWLRDDGDAQALLDAVGLSLEKFRQMDPLTVLRFGNDSVPLARVIASLEDFSARLREMGLTDRFHSYLRENYVFYSSAAPQVTFTGYYEPLLMGSRRPSLKYPFPLYGRPRDLVSADLSQFYFFKDQPGLPTLLRGRIDGNNRLVPYYSREEIDFKGALAGRGLEIAWIDSLVEVFFLHIQGSGIVQFEDGSRMFVGYADQNGHPFKSVSKFLLDRQLIDRGQLSMQGVKTHLNSRPAELAASLSSNPSYIFFQVNDQSATGTFGVRLTPARSVASDQRLFPLGVLAWIECEKPVLDGSRRITGWEKFGRFVLNQDTGGAIRGADRVDLFTGSGDLAATVAGAMKQKGALFFLLKKESAK